MTPACVWLFFPVCPLLCTYAKWPFGLVSEKTAVHYNYVYPPTWPSPTHLHYSSTHTIHIHAHTHMHTRTHTYSHTHAHTHACMHTHTHTSSSPQEQAASTIVYCAAHPSMDDISGLYMYDCWPTQPSPEAQDPSTAAALWELSECIIAKKMNMSHVETLHTHTV